MIARILAAAILGSVALAAQQASQPPIPREAEPRQPEQQQTANNQEPARVEQEAAETPSAIIEAPQAESITAVITNKTESENGKSAIDWPMIGITGIIAVFTGLLWWVSRRQARILNAQKETLDATLNITKVIERPYVRMSHEQPGITFAEPPEPPAVRATLNVLNVGHSPADILDVHWSFAFNQAELDAERNRPAPARDAGVLRTLLYNSPFYFTQYREIPTDLLEQVLAFSQPIYVVGCVVYRDHFDRKRCRHWYGRRYGPPLPGSANNLFFMFEEHPEFTREEELD